MIRFDSYSVLRKAGAGGLADVYLAEVPIDAPSPGGGLLPGDQVALKVLREPARSASSLRRFLREGHLLQRLEHPCLPRCYQVLEEPRPCIVLEWLEGQTLKEAIKEQGGLPHEVSLEVADAVLRGLAFLHDHAVVHRDVKPGNIFLTSDGRVLILDLGLAADPAAPLDTTVGDVMGTYAYMAPEQIAGAAIDHRADLYSLGISLYEAVSGKRPYKARGPGGYLRAHTVGAATPLRELRPGGLPARLEELVGRLMARDPAARPQTSNLALAILTGHLTPRRALSQPPMVGRAGAMGAIEAALDLGRAVHIHGEPGMGLGRVAREAWRMARGRQMEAIAVRCRGGRDPLAPLDRLREDLSRAVGPIGESTRSLQQAVAGLLGEGPLFVVVEDIDEAAPEVRGALMELLSQPGLSLLTTSSAPLGLRGHTLELRPLDRAEVHSLIAGMLGTTTAPAGLADKLHRFSAGLPAAVVLTVRDFFEKGILECVGIGDEGDTAWKLTASLRMTPDNSLKFVFRGRLDGLDAEERRLLALLAVAREEVPLHVALRVAKIPDGSLAPERLVKSWLATLRRAADGDWLSVRRPALASLVAAAMSEEQIRSVNAAIARDLAQQPSGPWRDQRLPFYRAYGASSAHAARAQVRIGEWLSQRGQHAQALEVLTRASHQEGLDADTAARCALARGQVLLALSRPGEAVDAMAAARRLGEDLAQVDLVAEAAVGLAQARMHLGQLRRAGDLAEEVLVSLDGRPPTEVKARAELISGHSALLVGDLRRAAEAFRRCMDVGSQAGAKALVAQAYGGVGLIYFHTGRLGDAIRHMGQEAAWFRAIGQRDPLVRILFNLSRARTRAGDITGAVEAIEEAERMAAETSLAPLEALAGVGRANLLLRCGDVEGASELLRRHWLAGEADTAMFVRMQWLAARVAVRMASADANAALATCNRLVEEAERVGWESLRAFHSGLIAVLRAHAADLAEALEALADVGDHELSARLLLSGARMGGDVEVLDAAAAEARASGDRLLQVEVLHALGGAAHQREAHGIARSLVSRAPEDFQRRLEVWAPIRWAFGQR